MRPVLLGSILFLAATANAADYARDIKPILRERCYACHGALAQKGKLRLDSGKHVLKVVTPKKPGESTLLDRITAADESERMPPEGVPLTPEQIAAFKAWISEGATFPADDQEEADPRDHWAFRPPVRPTVPATKIESTNPIDHFLADEWGKRKLKPQPPADKRILLRRLYLDLIGLPPTLEQIAAFEKDSSPNAYEKVVDQLLASPRYGERWGRHFLDVWRYSDWWGLGAEVRNSQKHMWHWRDWVIESFNADKGYDQMVRELLAADELYPNDLDKLRATGYLARQYFRFNRNSWLDETVEHTAKAFLGLTWNCARCHDHKYDPIKQDDYYRLRAFFEPYQVRTEMLPGETDFEKDGLPRAFDCNADAPTYKFVRGDDKQPLTDRPVAPALPTFLAANGLNIQAVKLPAEAVTPQLRPHVLENYLARAKADGPAAEKAIRARAEADRAKASGSPAEAKAAAIRAAKAEKELAVVLAERALKQADEVLAKAVGTKRIGPGIKSSRAREALEKARAAVEKPGEAYTPLVGANKTAESNVEPEASRTKPFPATSTGRRSALANWIAARDNPLTARVLVNHVWARHFGRPLVATVFDFGRKGQRPTYPALLDWLAVEFMEQGWSVKHLHWIIVTSAAYRRSSSNAAADPATAASDPENRYLWRQNPLRMDAPTVRDSLLHLAGDLDLTPGGVAVPPAQQPTSRRRSVYFFQSHNEHDKFLTIFDDANVLECYRRSESIVPQQALALSNSSFAMSQAVKIATKLTAKSDAEFVAAGFALILGSVPTADERTACEQALNEFRKLASGTADEKAKRARLLLVQSLLNHNDFVTIR
jgi:mono/diheme cytochrome c family protein